MRLLCIVIVYFSFCQFTQAYTFDRKMPSEVKQEILKDLSFMSSIEGRSPSALHQEIFGLMNGDNYNQFFKDRVKKFGLSTCGSKNSVACVIPWVTNTVYLTENYTKFKHPQIARLLVLYHEARHTEGHNRNWPHAKCPQPFNDENGQARTSIWTGASLAGAPGCDSSYKGAYGSTVVLMKNIALNCENCSEKVLMDAEIYADDQLIRVTDPKAKEDILNDLYR